MMEQGTILDHSRAHILKKNFLNDQPHLKVSRAVKSLQSSGSTDSRPGANHLSDINPEAMLKIKDEEQEKELREYNKLLKLIVKNKEFQDLEDRLHYRHMNSILRPSENDLAETAQC